MSVRDIRLRWPEAERLLGVEGELVITRDRKPVARLLPFRPPAKAAPRLHPGRQLSRIRKAWKGSTLLSTSGVLEDLRTERASVRPRHRD